MKKNLIHLIQVFDLKKFIRFGCIGVLNTLVDFTVFYVLDRWVIRDGPACVLWGVTILTGPYLSNAAAYAVANIHSFFWNKLWTFRSRGRVTGPEVRRHLLTSAGYLLLSSLTLAVSMRLLAGVVSRELINPLSKLPTACVTMFYNYLMNKFWVFRK